MDLSPHVDLMRTQLAAVGGVGGTETAALVDRLAESLDHAARLAIQGAVVAAAEEITGEITPGSVEVRLHGRDLDFVVDLPEPPTDDAIVMSGWLPSASAPVAADTPGDNGTARISFRPPEQLKARIEDAAEHAGLSVNAFLVTTLTAALAAPSVLPAPGRGGDRGKSATGWFQ